MRRCVPTCVIITAISARSFAMSLVSSVSNYFYYKIVKDFTIYFVRMLSLTGGYAIIIISPLGTFRLMI